ncbi:enoyl-CoA hydratase [Agrobacterium rhizogenes]|nr:enoyl-CoA hydratase [Rhizobium rhizogenes]NTH35902.1 enoyl-CoA hydratase [Rhizobium rhizogenes]
MNALDRATLDMLVDALRAFDSNSTIRAIVISGAKRAFAAGADIGALASAGPVELYTSGFSDRWDDVAAIRKPIIAAISGYALGGGLELALICDIVVCESSTVLGLPETAIGVMPGAGGTQRLVRSVGKSMAMEIILAGRRLTAEEALRVGIASTIAEEGTSEATALEIASRISTAAPLAISFAKQAVLQSQEMHLAAGIRFERALASVLVASEDRAEGMVAFSERRTARFIGR